MRTNLHNLSLLIVFSLLITITASALNLEFRIKIFENRSAISSLKLSDYFPLRIDENITEVGAYTNFLMAKKGQSELDDLGYTSTEVVSYFNNIPVSLDDAFTLMDNHNEKDQYATNYSISEAEMNRVLENVRNSDFYYTVFFTVRTEKDVDGFFSLPITSDKIIVTTGNNRYAFGKYYSFQNATDVLKMIRENGFEDAEIVSFDSLERIPLLTAIEKEKRILELTLATLK